MTFYQVCYKRNVDIIANSENKNKIKKEKEILNELFNVISKNTKYCDLYSFLSAISLLQNANDISDKDQLTDIIGIMVNLNDWFSSSIEFTGWGILTNQKTIELFIECLNTFLNCGSVDITKQIILE